MMARGHALSGAAVWLAAAPPAIDALGHPLSGPAVLAGAVVTAGAALIPDLDSGRSTPARALGAVTQLVGLLVRGLAGGHREATHSVLVCTGVAAVVTVAVTLGGRGAALAIGAVCVGLALRALGPRELRGGRLVDISMLLAALVVTALGHYTVESVAWLPTAVALGLATHLIGDVLSGEGGVPLAWPHPTHYAVPVLGTVGGLRETAVTAALALAVIALAVPS